jgi:hypothetical protein
VRFLLLIASDEKSDIPYGTPEWDQQMVEYRAFSAEAQRRGAMVAGDPLQSTETATTLRMQDGRLVTLDGPYAETREQLGGFYLLDCRDEDEALELAAMIPTARRGAIEVRRLAGHDSRYLDHPHPRYMVLIYGAEADYLPPGDSRLAQAMDQHRTLTSETVESGEYVVGDGLYPPSMAKTVRVKDGKSVVTDGPFAETREQLGGFYIFACHDLDRALSLASRLPFTFGCLEVRPLLVV